MERLRIPLEPGSNTLPHVVAKDEVDRLSGIRRTSGRVVYAYYLGRAVAASSLMPFSEPRWDPQWFRDNATALREMKEEAGRDRLLAAAYNRGAIHELQSRQVLLSSK